MGKSYAYARFVNLLVADRKNSDDKEFEGCDEVLSFVAEAGSTETRVRFTDLVRHLEFGTGPTVLRKCTLLVHRGYLKIETSDGDKRVKLMTLTSKGQKYLIERSNQMRQIAKETDY